jgi:hypothetical protein
MICSKSTVEGPYGFISSIQVPFSKAGTSARHFIGVVTYDGHGTAKANGILLSADGHEETVTATGLYDLDSHCIGRVTLKDQSNAIADWRFVVVSGTSELLTISDQSVETAPFLQKKQ